MTVLSFSLENGKAAKTSTHRACGEAKLGKAGVRVKHAQSRSIS